MNINRGQSKVAVVGAGPGGLAAGMILAANGYDVSIYEKQSYVGGRTSRMQVGHYHFDRGATFVMMLELWEELFQLVGKNLHDYVKLHELDPLYSLRFQGVDFQPSRDRNTTKGQIDALFPGEGDGYVRFMKDQERVYGSVKPLLQRPFKRWSDMLSKDVLRALPNMQLTDTVYSRLSRYFRDERLKASFSFQSKYLGMSPWECPGTFTFLSYIEHQFGLFHPVGGVHRLCEVMADLFREFGGKLHFSTGVKQILVKNGRAHGLWFENDERVDADDVVLNADFGYAAENLFAPGTLKTYAPRALQRKKLSLSTYMLYLGLNRKVTIPHHTILFADDYKRNTSEITKLGVLSKDPSIYVHNPGMLDPTLAPPGKTALYVLVPVPNLKGSPNWKDPVMQRALRQEVLARLSQEPELSGIEQWIEEEAVITPQHWQDNHQVFHGATFNLAHSLDQMMVFRPHNQFQEVERCYLVGGGTHPGSGLPTILQSAMISSELLMNNSQKEQGWLGYRSTARQQETTI